MTLAEIVQAMHKIPYSTLQAFIEESYSDEEYRDFHERSVKTCFRTHDPKGFRVDEILSNVFCGDEDAILEFIRQNL